MLKALRDFYFSFLFYNKKGCDVMVTFWTVKDMVHAVSTNLGAGLSGEVISGTNTAPHFNYLAVTNRDVVDIQIFLDNQSVAGRTFDVPAGASMVIEANENIFFSTLTQKNLHGSTAQTASAIRFTAMYKVVF